MNNCDIYFKITNLKVGDFVITNSIEDLDIQNIIERKSVQDLCSSITDGRFREQKQRLLDSIGEPCKISYIIEGSLNKNMRLSKNVLQGAVLNLIYKHQYKVIHTQDKLETFDIIISLYKKWKMNEFVIDTKQSTLIKRSDKLNDNKFINQLCMVNGVSFKIAEAIQNNELFDKNKNVKTLIDLYNSMDVSKAEKLFESILIINPNGKSRKIGSAVSKKIHDHFCI
jgi:ERCC4-type nuclease